MGSKSSPENASSLSPSEQSLLAVAFAIFMVLAILVVFWYNNHALIAKLIGHYRLAQIAVLSLFTNELTAVAEWLRTTDPSTVTWKQVSYVGTAVGGYTRYLFIPLLIAAGWYLFTSDIRTNYSRAFDVHRLIATQVKLWPHLRVLLGKDLITLNPLSGPWASPLTEHDMAIKYQLLNADGTVNRPKTEEVLLAQLGDAWRGPNHLKPHEKAIFALLAGRVAARDNENSQTEDVINKWVDHLSTVMVDGKTGLPPKSFDVTWADKMIDRCIKHERVARITNSHHYVYGVMLSLLHAARESGVFLPSAHIMWLRPLDQQLFFTLNALTVDVGRGLAVHSQTIGTFSHWLAEIKAGGAINEPYLASAIEGFEAAVADYVMDTKKATMIRRKLEDDIAEARNKIAEYNKQAPAQPPAA